jgi:hypothetical protein
MHAWKPIARSLCVLSALAGCASQPTSRELKEMPGAVYHAPLGNYTAIVPPLLGPGIRQSESAAGDGSSESVAFSDDFGTLLDIRAWRMPVDDLLPPFATQVRADQLDAFVDRRVLPALLGRSGAVVHRELVATAAGKALFLVVSLPGGSARVLHDAGGRPYHPDVIRGMLVFPQLRWAYTVADQQWPPTPNQPALTPADRNGLLLSDLRQTVARMTFD